MNPDSLVVRITSVATLLVVVMFAIDLVAHPFFVNAFVP